MISERCSHKLIDEGIDKDCTDFNSLADPPGLLV